MPFSTLFERRAKQRELERLRVIKEVTRAAAALRARFDLHSDIDLKPYEDLDEGLRRRIDWEGIRIE